MREAFDSYFKKLREYAMKELGTLPSVPYSEKGNRNIIVSEPDEEGYVEWIPKLQDEEIDWKSIEKELGFVVCDELKAYYSTYLFASLDGKFEGVYLHFDPIGDGEIIYDTVKRHFSDGQYYFPNSQTFVLGMAIVDEDDNYFIFYDNRTSGVFVYENDRHNTVVLTNSIADVIDSMEARMWHGIGII